MRDHTISVNLSQVIQGENTYTCAVCQKQIVLVWNGYMQGDIWIPTNWGLRPEDANNKGFGDITIIGLMS